MQVEGEETNGRCKSAVVQTTHMKVGAGGSLRSNDTRSKVRSVRWLGLKFWKEQKRFNFNQGPIRLAEAFTSQCYEYNALQLQQLNHIWARILHCKPLKFFLALIVGLERRRVASTIKRCNLTLEDVGNSVDMMIEV